MSATPARFTTGLVQNTPALTGRFSRSSLSISQLNDSIRSPNRTNSRFSASGVSIPEEAGPPPPPTAKRGLIKGAEKTSPGATTDSTKESRRRVGTAMRELTGQRIAIGAMIVGRSNDVRPCSRSFYTQMSRFIAQAYLMIILSEWRPLDSTQQMTMIVLHGQTANPKFAEREWNNPPLQCPPLMA